MDLEVQKKIEIEDGKHTGEIVRLEYREEKYRYTDVFIKLDGEAVELKYGCPTFVSENSKLGKLLVEFGAVLREGETVNPDKVLLGRRCSFMTLNESSEQGTFARVVVGSVKPLREEKA